MTGDRGQALVLAVLALALAAATIVGLQAAQDRILADALVELIVALRDARGTRAAPSGSEIEALVADPLIAERSRAAAEELSVANGGGPVRDLTISAGTRAVDIALSVGAHRQRASIGLTCCRR